ncbi:hypothetical protein CLV51_10893 [Chitinophaga niastensis]|uniref:Uncharacterized protein n=1 Tax=Chitinophaga niastensis TaxID=536980 RepID=A0A2P8HB10_CHINA|nr:hypothetical protein [Chitinophaga niastensis]PSL43404.1 hypothetical protein CLV51_10893 [Chitinophaga niastensis]
MRIAGAGFTDFEARTLQSMNERFWFICRKRFSVVDINEFKRRFSEPEIDRQVTDNLVDMFFEDLIHRHRVVLLKDGIYQTFDKYGVPYKDSP